MRNYTEKEICIFNGVMHLCKSGKKIYNITVQDIADAANVGKGTLYEYFSSKEEIIVNALVYFLCQENQRAIDIADSKASFKEKVWALYDLVTKSFEEGFAAVSRLMSGDTAPDISKILKDNKTYIDKVMTGRTELVKKILKSGESEGAISLDFDSDYITMAIMANLSCLNQCIHLPQAGLELCQNDQKKQYAYTLLLKSLNH